MKAAPLAIPDVFLIERQVFGDNRGFFFESFNQTKFEQAIGNSVFFVQDNHSKSVKGVLRGLLHRLLPIAQGKLVRVVLRAVFDVAVMITKGSPTFGKWVGEVLSAENRRQLWIPSFSLLQAIQWARVKTLVFSSSATFYREPQQLPLDEGHPTSATNPYGRSKLNIEEMLKDLVASDPAWRMGCLRYFNSVGAHESGLSGENTSGVPNNLMP